jgi:NAD(P)-dependent dehydrogenase (short-subunit alcohol dehydrogenase family)
VTQRLRVWVTGSADGIGRAIAQELVARGHEVLLHGRNPARAEAAMAAVPGAQGVVAGDLESIAQTRALADEVRARGPWHAVVHNAGVRAEGGRRPVTVDGLERQFAVNVVAPYLLTVLLPVPDRLVYLSSQLHVSGAPDFGDLQWARRRYRGGQAYSDSKLMVAALGFAVAAHFDDISANVVDPGWVRTRMGGPGAPASLALGAAMPVALVVGEDAGSGRYLSSRPGSAHPSADDPAFQRAVLDACAQVSDTPWRPSRAGPAD